VVRQAVERVFTPKLRVTAPRTVEVALRRKGGRLLVHLLNFAEMQVAGDFAVTDFIPPVGPVEIRLALDRQPARVTLEPGGRTITGQWTNGVWTGVIRQVPLYEIVAFETGS
jgi:hypothetical protein